MSLRVDEGMLWAAGRLPPLLPHFLEHLGYPRWLFLLKLGRQGCAWGPETPSSLSFTLRTYEDT